MKNATKAKAAAIKKSQTQTGGGDSPIHVLDPEENQVLDILNPMQIEGLPILETITEFNFDKFEIIVHKPNEDKQIKGENMGDINDNDKENVRVNVDIPENKKPNPPKKSENRVQRLTHTIQATETMNAQMAEKLREKKNYHEKKLALMEENIATKNRIAAALEGVAAALKSRTNSRLD